MKENHLIGNILSDGEEGSPNMSSNSNQANSRDPLAEAKLKYANIRSSSAPPVLPDNVSNITFTILPLSLLSIKLFIIP